MTEPQRQDSFQLLYASFLLPSIMPPLTRQPTHTSVQSWWSDSNPLLVANPIHTGAKPLMKRMYHRDILNFIKRQQGIPLSPETINIYASYLEWRYVSDASKIAICTELRARAEVEDEAQAIIASGWLSNLVLHSSNTGELSHACRMLGILAQHESTIGAVLEVEPCMQLITLLR
ncbi:hypothetical protein C8R43DRAFT_610411 [Mycena crocata]|nr:hypothetical protein C8R43DRAFT_610411 [Mycena crocata]